MTARVLIVSTPGVDAAAVVQADIDLVTSLGGRPLVAVDAEHLRASLEGSGADAITVGRIGDWEAAAAIADVLADFPHIPVVLDPVMVSDEGATLMDEDTSIILVERLVPLAAVVTPGVPDLELLTGTEVVDEADLLLAAQELQMTRARAVLASGGHILGNTVVDYLVTADGPTRYISNREDSHGARGALASALALGLAQGLPLSQATSRARGAVHRATLAASRLGRAERPLA